MFKNKRINYCFGLALSGAVIALLFFELMVCKTTAGEGALEITISTSFNPYDFAEIFFKYPDFFNLMDDYWQILSFVTMGMFVVACANVVFSVIGLVAPDKKWNQILFSTMLWILLFGAIAIVVVMILITSTADKTSIEPQIALFLLWAAVPVINFFALIKSRKLYNTFFIVILALAATSALPMLLVS